MIFAVSECIESASPREVTLVEQTIDASFLEDVPARLNGDKAYDSDPLDACLHKGHNIELIAPHKGNQRKAVTQDGRPLRRYCKRWRVE